MPVYSRWVMKHLAPTWRGFNLRNNLCGEHVWILSEISIVFCTLELAPLTQCWQKIDRRKCEAQYQYCSEYSLPVFYSGMSSATCSSVLGLFFNRHCIVIHSWTSLSGELLPSTLVLLYTLQCVVYINCAVGLHYILIDGALPCIPVFR